MWNRSLSFSSLPYSRDSHFTGGVRARALRVLNNYYFESESICVTGCAALAAREERRGGATSAGVIVAQIRRPSLRQCCTTSCISLALPPPCTLSLFLSFSLFRPLRYSASLPICKVKRDRRGEWFLRISLSFSFFPRARSIYVDEYTVYRFLFFFLVLVSFVATLLPFFILLSFSHFFFLSLQCFFSVFLTKKC